MASPQLGRATSDQKPTESTPTEDENKPETNGHASPAEKSENKADKPLKSPAVNGDGKSVHPKTLDDVDDSVSKEKDTETDAPVKVVSKDADNSGEKVKSAEPEEQTNESKAPSKSASTATAEPSQDVEMTSSPDEKLSKKADRKSEKSSKSAEPSEPAKGTAETKNVESTRAKDKVNGIEKTASSPTAPATVDQEDKSLKATDTDVPMSEAPSTAAKISRGREDDVDVEPAPKRAKKDSNVGATTSDATESTGAAKPQDAQDDLAAGEAALSGLPLWNDPERDPKPLTPHQTRELRKVLAGVKKTKHGAHFKDAVVKMWPSLADTYVLRVTSPMDIGELERNLRENKYSALRQFKDDLGKIYKNSVIFNGLHNEITSAALDVVKLAWKRASEIPSADPAKPKPAPKPSRHAEPRTPAPPPPARRQASIPAAGPPAKAEAEAYAVPPGGVPQVRRASAQNDLDRPKRAIQPTKNRDPDYSAKNFNKKKLSIELQFALEVLNELMDSKNAHCNFAFLAPVDPVALAIPTYFTIIKRPMDLSTIMTKLKSYGFQTIKEFQADVKQVFKNCYKFNQPGQPVYEQGQQLELIFRNLWSKKDQWIAKHTPAKPVSEASSRESEEEAEEEEESPAATVDNSSNKTIQMLEKRLEEETRNLAQLYKTADIAGDTMIDLSQSLISTIRSRILLEKQNLASQKPAKAAKAKAKAPKQTKQKANSAPSKKAATASAPKKSGGGGGGGSKKAKTQRSMTQPEKDDIANAINDLESPHIERAIEIIKMDTGQSENSSGELELEIDQLTNEALQKLWDLCKKALPTFANGAAAAPAREPSPANAAPAKSSNKSAKPKKNKPMNAQEQEARIAELERLRGMYGTNPQGDQERSASSTRANEAPVHDNDTESSDDSEEE